VIHKILCFFGRHNFEHDSYLDVPLIPTRIVQCKWCMTIRLSGRSVYYGD